MQDIVPSGCWSCFINQWLGEWRHMSTAYNAAGKIKDILYDTAHILLLGEYKEERSCCSFAFSNIWQWWGSLIFHIRELNWCITGDKKPSNMHLSVVLGPLSIFLTYINNNLMNSCIKCPYKNVISSLFKCVITHLVSGSPEKASEWNKPLNVIYHTGKWAKASNSGKGMRW